MPGNHPQNLRQAADVDMDMDESTANVSMASAAAGKRKRQGKVTTLAQFTIREPTWNYIHLSLVRPAAKPVGDLDALTVHLHLQSALGQFLGVHGSAIPVDVMKLDAQDAWIRVPYPDANSLVAAVGGWVGRDGEGWMVRGKNAWGPDHSGHGAELFNPE